VLEIDTLPLFTPQNEFVSEAFEQSTAFVAAAGTAATEVPWRTQLKQTSGWRTGPRATTVPSLE
jgi:hypothetical protein